MKKNFYACYCTPLSLRMLADPLLVPMKHMIAKFTWLPIITLKRTHAKPILQVQFGLSFGVCTSNMYTVVSTCEIIP